jgi:polysaccharide pyruvyl transferase WcaK-like protein
MTAAPHRVGVLTFHRCINNGSYWQARCLVDSLRARELDVQIMDHRSRRVDVAEWRCALNPTLPTPVAQGDRALYREKVRAFFSAISRLPLSAPFTLDSAVGVSHYDTVVVGSDEVWNVCHPWYGGVPLFFGDGLRADRLVSYAASCGSYDGSRGVPEWSAEGLQRFASISVRDDNSHAIVAAATGDEPDVVLDPCLEHVPTPEGQWSGPDTPFVVVYGHNFTPTFVKEVRRWAKARGYRLLSVSYRNDWADDQWLAAGPHDYAHAMARARAVVTNFFHGCVFALAYERPFLCETSPYRWHKVRSLMHQLGADVHLASESTPSAAYDERLESPIDEHILIRIAEQRLASAAYLDRSVG